MPQKEELILTNETMRFGDEIFQMRNIVRFGKYEKAAENGGFIFLLIISVVGTFLLGNVAPQFAPFGIGAIILFVIIISARKSKYFLRIETNSGSQELLWSTKEKRIDELIDMIYQIMSEKNRELKYTVNMNDYSVTDVVMGDKFSSIKDAVIATRGSVAQRR